MLAAETGDTNAIRELVSEGAEVNVTNSAGTSALWCAQNAGKLGAVALLRELGASDT